MGKNTGIATNYFAKRVVSGSCGGTTGNISCTTKTLTNSTSSSSNTYINGIIYDNINSKYQLFFNPFAIFWHNPVPTSVTNINTNESVQWQSYLSSDEISYYVSEQALLADGTYSIWWGNTVGTNNTYFDSIPSTFSVQNGIFTFISAP